MRYPYVRRPKSLLGQYMELRQQQVIREARQTEITPRVLRFSEGQRVRVTNVMGRPEPDEYLGTVTRIRPNHPRPYWVHLDRVLVVNEISFAETELEAANA